MLISRSPLNRNQIVAALVDILSLSQVNTDEREIKLASVDRFKKYPAAHGIFDGPYPAAIVYPLSTDEVAAVLKFANDNLVAVVPKTGGSGTEGGLEVIVPDSIVIDGSKMDKVLAINKVDMMLTVQCGVTLQTVEDQLREIGLTTGHSPQSKPIAQYGGLTATRSIGQFSTLYGGIEDMVIGLEAVFPDGSVSRIRNVPRRAAGPDLRHIVIGNEGALCYITEVTVKIFQYQPENNRFFGFLIDNFGDGIDALRELVVSGYQPSVCRVYSPEDARQHFSDVYQGKCVVVLVAEGPAPLAEATSQAIVEIFRDRPHIALEEARIRSWFDHLNWDQSAITKEREEMIKSPHLAYTTEVSIDWSRVNELYESVMQRIRTDFPRANDITMLGGHSSHSYQTGTNLYFVYDYWICCEPRDEITEYHEPLNAIIVEEALRLGGSMVHHHGVGKYRAGWSEQEHGSSYQMMTALKNTFDPNGIMNPGTIIPISR